MNSRVKKIRLKSRLTCYWRYVRLDATHSLTAYASRHTCCSAAFLLCVFSIKLGKNTGVFNQTQMEDLDCNQHCKYIVCCQEIGLAWDPIIGTTTCKGTLQMYFNSAGSSSWRVQARKRISDKIEVDVKNVAVIRSNNGLHIVTRWPFLWTCVNNRFVSAIFGHCFSGTDRDDFFSPMWFSEFYTIAKAI